MTDFQTLIDRNLKFASGFDQGDLTIPPRLSTLVVTCIDPRVDPAYFLGLQLGDAFVIRNVGGRVTDGVIEQIAIMRGLVAAMGSGSFEVAIIHHTECGVRRFADPQFRQELGQASGTGEAALEALAATDPQSSVAQDVSRLRAASMLPGELVVAGYVYNVTNGQIQEVHAPTRLRD
ncbi:MAG: carbonic anhydrase [Gemmatimonadota bacterium]